MTEQHPITPPPELVHKWEVEGQHNTDEIPLPTHIATQAARWGADKELEACLEWLFLNGWGAAVNSLRAARRPKPPSLAERALEALEIEDDSLPLMSLKRSDRFDLIRRALERLQELEKGND